MKQSNEEIIDRIKYLSINNFIYEPNKGLPQWKHKSGFVLVKQDLVDNANPSEWDRLTDSIEFFCNKNNF